MSDNLEEEEYGKLEYTRLVSNEQVLINSPVMWEEEPRVDKNHPFSVEKEFFKKSKNIPDFKCWQLTQTF